ncbi:UDP-N-acetylmuramoyl-L-alanine--D-glutamate ligase [Candidatus Ruminimicrobiellum ovillum]|uniref:UDP-N-acetylmuramoyl-L-alanine--D-glutamate ligase n=1 Tax=Candidatus Ruminimicrobiellum ovillum TaxID=1947927 RepID=UPI00355955DC
MIKNNGIKIAVLGLGKSGIACANLAISKGYDVFASDSGKTRTHKQMKLNKNVKLEFGKHSKKVLDSDIIIKSPGLPNDLYILKQARKKEIPILSELDFALNFAKPRKIIAVTGTNGKTTTTTLIYEIIKKGYKNTFVAGNIGFPISEVVTKLNSKSVLVLELSSYQLEDSPYFKPDISVSMNITPDHLKHHHTMANYVKAKANVFINQKKKDYAIYNYNDKYLKKAITKTKATKFEFNYNKTKNCIYYNDGTIYLKKNNKTIKLNPKINIPGKHNIDNILAAVAASYIAGTKPAIIEKVISNFKGVEHRIEFVKEINGVKYYNDSKGTNVDSTKVALESFDKNIQLILGGQDKGSPYKPIFNLIKKKVKNIFLIGEATNIIKKQLKGSAEMTECETLSNAIRKIHSVAEKGDIVLFSPACASFDQFNDFEHRGREFKKFVLAIK